VCSLLTQLCAEFRRWTPYSQLSIDGAILQEVYGRLLVCLHDKRC
jgi:hypothetical protein